METDKTIWTIGHSTRELDVFIEILHSFGIEVLADIRSFPGSRKFPHFNKENLAAVMPENNIRYMPIPQLGGRRKPNPDSVNTAWENSAFRAYADYMETIGFIEGIKILETTAREYRTAYMCSEAVWWRCHRSLVSDYLKADGWKVIHIMGSGKGREHTFTSPARMIEGKLSYKGILESV